MASKRTATSDLNHDNWDEDAEPEEAGTFKKASEEVLKQRVIKTARRRKVCGNEEESPTKKAFSGFSGFGKSNVQASSDSPFAFLNNLSNNTQLYKNGSNLLLSTSNTTTDTNKPSMIFTSPTKTDEKSKENGNVANLEKSNIDTKNTDYYASLKGLNESVANWIKTHVDKNPFCILTPIFKDYEKHLLEIEANKDKPVTTQVVNTNPLENKTVSSQDKGNAFSESVPKASETNLFLSNTITFGKTDEKSPFSSAPTLNFGTGSSTKAETTGFSFGTGAPFTFANVSKPIEEKKTQDETAEEDEPPKVEFTPVVEDDHIFTKRCKVFVKKDGNFGDRGVGQLFLKPVSGSEKVQLIVRADTNLGNLLLNFILSESIPLQRMGKNNVMLVCIPTPDAKPPPVPVLLRVKTSDEADELLKILEKNKN